MTINELRCDWIRQRLLCESQLAALDRQREAGLLKDDIGEPAWRWHKALDGWLGDLEKLLAEFPEESVAPNFIRVQDPDILQR
jgi:hypothetical protein